MSRDQALTEALRPIVDELVDARIARLVAEGKIKEVSPDASTADLDQRFGVRPGRGGK